MPTSCGLTEAAEQTGLSTHQVRNYLHFRLIHAAERSVRGHYQFDQAAVNRLRLIGLATRAGMHLESLRQFLATLDGTDKAARKGGREAVERFVHERRSVLRQLVRELNRACELPVDYGALESQRTRAKKCSV